MPGLYESEVIKFPTILSIRMLVIRQGHLRALQITKSKDMTRNQDSRLLLLSPLVRVNIISLREFASNCSSTKSSSHHEAQWFLHQCLQFWDTSPSLPAWGRGPTRARRCSAMWKVWQHDVSHIHSDEWAAYRRLSDLGYNHSTVNHQLNFVDPESGAHTQSIERSWLDAKILILRRQRGVSRHLFQSHLDYYCWRVWRKNEQCLFTAFLTDVGSVNI